MNGKWFYLGDCAIKIKLYIYTRMWRIYMMNTKRNVSECSVEKTKLKNNLLKKKVNKNNHNIKVKLQGEIKDKNKSQY